MTDLELYFRYRCEKGLQQRGLANKPEYKERFEYEIKIIISMRYCNYFLIVSDVISWAIRNQIPVGVRGSAAGSLVAYCLKVTHVDPIKYKLIFERFLNPSRVSMPDIDLDIDQERREEVIEYTRQKYGSDNVAHIGTHGTLKAKAAIRDVARTLGLPYIMGDKLARMTLDPIAGKPQPLKECYEKVAELKKIRQGPDTDEKKILIWAEQVENRIKSFGTHAAGVVISEDKISKTVPLYIGKEGAVTTQFEMNTVEDVGLIKFDFLGLRALTTIDRCVKMVSKRYGINIDPLQIPVDDEQVYKILQTGDTKGVFQLENSQGIRDLLVIIKPTCIEDISLLVSVYRPGPLSSKEFSHYLKVRQGQADPHYLIPELKSILEETQGLYVYQEQITEICKQLAGYSMAEADIIRKSIGKKKAKEMAEQYPKFITGMINNKISEENAKQIWSDIEEFAAYSFNKSHAISYSYIGYQMAWLKTHYPLEFICSCLISDSDEIDKVIGYISYCKEKGIKILSPDINESQYNFSITDKDKSIRFGLGAIKNIGKSAREIIEEREANGHFKDIIEFSERVNLSKVNKGKIESLVLAGAFDQYENYNRNSLLNTAGKIVQYKKDKEKYTKLLTTYTKKKLLYDARQQEIARWLALTKEEVKKARAAGKKKPNNIKMPIAPKEPSPVTISAESPILIQDQLAYEKELLGYFISGHPLDNVKETSEYTIAKIKEQVHEGKIRSKQSADIIAIPSIVNVFTTKAYKKKMAYVTLEDKTGTIEAIVLPRVFEESSGYINVKTPALYHVILDIVQRDTEQIIKMKIQHVYTLPSIQDLKNKPLDIIVPIENALNAAKILLKSHGNDCKVQFLVQSDNNIWKMGIFTCKGDRINIEKQLKEAM